MKHLTPGARRYFLSTVSLHTLCAVLPMHPARARFIVMGASYALQKAETGDGRNKVQPVRSSVGR